ncbi:MAG TPA: sigma 54-interacting transcriptional regulator [Myxococcota bacterium]|nr:sigma 54-interacting transcriptional regulator [Myxococcota bacterium]
MDDLALLDRMRLAPALRRLPLGELDRLASRGRVRRFAPASCLMEEGKPADGVFLLLSGQVAVRKQFAGGEERVIAVRRDGDWIGEMALLDDGPRSASAFAETAVIALWLPRDAFMEAVTRNSEAVLDLLRTVVTRLRESDSHLIEVLQEKNKVLAASNLKLTRENRRLQGELDERYGFDAFVGSSAAARRLRAAARRAAESDVPVLIRGETGTGKELVARAVHTGSQRAAGRFVPVNCAIFTETLLESALFGHARGAFTGASCAKAGLVEAADGGTLFLDEIADMPTALQGALLRFLELGEFRRLGETEVRHSRARVIAATHHDLESAVRSGAFRRDLFYRLDVLSIVIPPLREREDDIPELVRYVAARVAERLRTEPLRFDPAAVVRICAYDFPGNVRELENEVERLYALLGPAALVTPEALSPKMLQGTMPQGGHYADAVRHFKAQLVAKALEEAGGNRAHAAERLGVHRSNLVRMIRELGVREGSRASLGGGR